MIMRGHGLVGRILADQDGQAIIQRKWNVYSGSFGSRKAPLAARAMATPGQGAAKDITYIRCAYIIIDENGCSNRI